jgi:type IV secretory pathway TrbD component
MTYNVLSLRGLQMKKSEINGIVLLVGTLVLAVGVWIEYTFGMALITLGTSWIVAALLANGDEK